MMNEDPQIRESVKKSTTRYLWLTRYDNESGGDSESNETGNMKNFPRTFIPMEELEESPE